MCPEKERQMREREGLLHKYEIDEKTKHKKKPKADPARIVKCFSRSAAGQIMTDPNSLRPPHDNYTNRFRLGYDIRFCI